MWGARTALRHRGVCAGPRTTVARFWGGRMVRVTVEVVGRFPNERPWAGGERESARDNRLRALGAREKEKER